jgi:hypothetical protein
VNKAQTWISAGFVLACSLTLVRPPWRQTFNGKPLVYAQDLGQHFIWEPPQATGETSWLVNAPASQCEVLVDRGRLAWQIAALFIVAIFILFVCRNRPKAGASDWKYSATFTVMLLCAAGFLGFGIRHGFEGQIGWIFACFPGLMASTAFLNQNNAQHGTELGLILFISASFAASALFYYAICDAAIAAVRRISSTETNRGSETL